MVEHGSSEHLSALEQHFPRIVHSICMLWGHGECEIYIKKLIFDDRGGRDGFSPQVASELMMLMSIITHHDRRQDPWSPRPG